MNILLMTFVVFAIAAMAAAIVGFSVTNESKDKGIKTMVLGVEITLVGGIIAADPNSSFGGFEYIIVLLGLGTTVFGLRR